MDELSPGQAYQEGYEEGSADGHDEGYRQALDDVIKAAADLWPVDHASQRLVGWVVKRLREQA